MFHAGSLARSGDLGEPRPRPQGAIPHRPISNLFPSVPSLQRMLRYPVQTAFHALWLHPTDIRSMSNIIFSLYLAPGRSIYWSAGLEITHCFRISKLFVHLKLCITRYCLDDNHHRSVPRRSLRLHMIITNTTKHRSASGSQVLWDVSSPCLGRELRQSSDMNSEAFTPDPNIRPFPGSSKLNNIKMISWTASPAASDRSGDYIHKWQKLSVLNFECSPRVGECAWSGSSR